MTTWTDNQLARPEISRNPMTVFAILATPGDTWGAYRMVSRDVVGPDANPHAFLRVTFSGHGSTWTAEYPNPFGADLVPVDAPPASRFVLDGVDGLEWSDDAGAYITSFPALAYGPEYSYGVSPIVSRRVAEAFVAHMTFARIVFGDVDRWEWVGTGIRVTPWNGDETMWVNPDELGRFDLGVVGYTFAIVDPEARVLRPVPADPMPDADTVEAAGLDSTGRTGGPFAAEDVAAAVCSQCGDAPPVAYGMCGSCIHDARRSGWEPGDTV